MMCCTLLHQNGVCVSDTIVGHLTCCQGPVMSQIHICIIPVHPQSLTPLEKAYLYIYIYIYIFICMYVCFSSLDLTVTHATTLKSAANEDRSKLES
jgi:hypothetical protein